MWACSPLLNNSFILIHEECHFFLFPWFLSHQFFLFPEIFFDSFHYGLCCYYFEYCSWFSASSLALPVEFERPCTLSLPIVALSLLTLLTHSLLSVTVQASIDSKSSQKNILFILFFHFLVFSPCHPARFFLPQTRFLTILKWEHLKNECFCLLASSPWVSRVRTLFAS